VEGNTKVSQNYENEHQVGKSGISVSRKALFSGKIKWLSLVGCLVVLLVAVLALAQGAFAGTQGAHAALAKQGVKSPKHTHALSRPGRSKPVLSASPLSLSFSASASNRVPSPQIVTIKNGGTRALYWRASVSPSVSWITLPALKTQSLGICTSSDQPGQLKVYVSAAKLSAGTYTTQITLAGTDQQGQTAAGSPQTIAVTFVVS
jgi:hypothetical protein